MPLSSEELKNLTYLASLLQVAAKVHHLQEGFSLPQLRLLQILDNALDQGDGWVALSDLATARNQSLPMVRSTLEGLIRSGHVAVRCLFAEEGHFYRITAPGAELLLRMELATADHEHLQRFIDWTEGGWVLPGERQVSDTSHLKRRVLELLKVGPTPRCELRRSLMLTDSQLGHTLSSMRAEGSVIVVTGLYALPGTQGMTAPQTLILGALADGPLTRQAVIAATGLTPNSADGHLSRLVQKRIIRRCKAGYEITPQVEQEDGAA